MRVLVSISGEADVQIQLDGVVRNKDVYEKISRGDGEIGIHQDMAAV